MKAGGNINGKARGATRPEVLHCSFGTVILYLNDFLNFFFLRAL